MCVICSTETGEAGPHIALYTLWEQKTGTGFVQRVLPGYHATNAANVTSILTKGFNKSANNRMLGPGVYMSTDREKCFKYGAVTLKLLFSPGTTPTHFLYVHFFKSKPIHDKNIGLSLRLLSTSPLREN